MWFGGQPCGPAMIASARVALFGSAQAARDRATTMIPKFKCHRDLWTSGESIAGTGVAQAAQRVPSADAELLLSAALRSRRFDRF